ncbi:MAG TPA: hypothetical protein VEM13_02305 [Gemmatimonadales bacterium]|nr:hypothetical protein [Gemmatimonadales bacterium]
MSARRGWRRIVLAAVAAAACGGGTEQQQPAKPANWTMVIGIDVSGSFRDAKLYDDAAEFAGYYLYAHLHGLGGLRVPTAVFVGPIGGARASEPKPFHPINDLQGRTVEQIASDLRTWFPATDTYTDFNAFFQRVSQLVKERGLILAPLNVIVLSDGVPDVPPGARLVAGQNPYSRIDLGPLEFLSRSVTVRLLYANPQVGENWKRLIRHKRVRLWTQEWQVMAGWHRQVKPGIQLERQDDLWKWVRDNVDFRARAGNLF